MWYVLDKNNEPVQADTLVAAQWLEENTQKRVVACDEMPDGSVLSTVFLCLDHSMGRSDGPVLYESLWFDGPHDGHQRRYKTRQEAVEGHASMLQEYGEYLVYMADKLANV
jgi:hypothetical protein